jgi:hypothetical protein
VKQILTETPVHDFKSCVEEWVKHWGHCTELDRDYFEKFKVAAIKILYIFFNIYNKTIHK